MVDNRKGLQAMDDNELENVSGGFNADIGGLAGMEGRRVRVPMSVGACNCPPSGTIEFVYARSTEQAGGITHYIDVKCYFCNSQKDIFPPKGI